MILTDKDIIIDVETFSMAVLDVVGTYKYALDPSTELLLFSYAFGNDIDTVYTVDLTKGERIPDHIMRALTNGHYRKHAHNAVFEILILHKCLNVPLIPEQWYCSMAAVAFCGLELSLENSARTLAHGVSKQKKGKDLIKLFSCPDKDGKRTYNDFSMMTEWLDFIEYNQYDVRTEAYNLLCLPELPEIFSSGTERDMWIIDFWVNTNGLKVNLQLARNADFFCDKEDEELLETISHVGIKNPNSRKQVLDWLNSFGYNYTSLKAENYDAYIEQADDELVKEVLNVKQNLSLTSASKFKKYVDTALKDRIYGTLQYYGAVRTGRWSGRGVQVQNLKRNEMPMEHLMLLRQLVLSGDYYSTKMYFGNVKSNITELGRTVIEPETGNVFLSSDFSAIEARVTAWIAGEQWRIDVFNSHGKIYEASAAMMFKMRVEDIAKGSLERIKGKYAELALGFGGWVGAFKRFGADKYMSDKEILDTAKAWRKANPNIVAMWADVNECAVGAVRDFFDAQQGNAEYPDYVEYHGSIRTTKFGVSYQVIQYYGRRWLTCKLLSGRRLMYFDPRLVIDSRNNLSFTYRRMSNEQSTWFGMIVENVVQAIARDLLVVKMVKLYRNYGLIPALHVHDEIVIESKEEYKQELSTLLNNTMSEPVEWAQGLPLKGDTTVLPFYMKGE